MISAVAYLTGVLVVTFTEGPSPLVENDTLFSICKVVLFAAGIGMSL